MEQGLKFKHVGKLQGKERIHGRWGWLNCNWKVKGRWEGGLLSSKKLLLGCFKLGMLGSGGMGRGVRAKLKKACAVLWTTL